MENLEDIQKRLENREKMWYNSSRGEMGLNMSKDDIKKMKELDEAAELAGGFTSVIPSQDIHYDYRKISRYCKEKGIEPIDMTIRELNNFILSE